jgi:enoyl-CoA hydratase
MLRLKRRGREIIMRMRRAPQPIISLVQGAACGGGFALALASDIRIGGASMKMNAAFIRIGLSACDVGISYFLPRLVGVSVASELMMTGRFITAQRALASGLVSEVVPDAALDDAVLPYLEDMLATSPLGLRLTKDCLNHNINAASLEAAIAMEDRNQVLCLQGEDFREGVAAFIEKRAPRYSGR